MSQPNADGTTAPESEGSLEESKEVSSEEVKEAEGTSVTEAEAKDAKETEEAETKVEEIPNEVLREHLTKANREAANYRTKLREIEKTYAESKSAEEVEALVKEMTSAHKSQTRALTVENVALKHNLEPELAALLKGDTREEIEKHAQELTKFSRSSTTPPPHLEGGLTPTRTSSGIDDDDPIARVRALRGRRI